MLEQPPVSASSLEAFLDITDIRNQFFRNYNHSGLMGFFFANQPSHWIEMQLIDRGHFSWEISSRFEYQLWLQSHFNSIPGRHINDKNSIAEGLIDITCPDQYWWLEDTFYPFPSRERDRERDFIYEKLNEKWSKCNNWLQNVDCSL